MTLYRTRHADPIQRILAAYGQGPGLVSALETYVKSIEDSWNSSNVPVI
jgi:hypothetical protein